MSRLKMAIRLQAQATLPHRAGAGAGAGTYDGLMKDLLTAYAALVPLIAIRLTDSVAIGAVDLLAPLAFAAMVFCPRRRSMKAEELFVWLFIACAIVSTLFHIAIGNFNPRSLLVMRILSISFPFVIVMMINQFSKNDLSRLVNVFIWSGGTSIFIGIVLHTLGISTSDNIQQNWYDGLEATDRAGGLPGNSGDFGHIAAVWTVTCISFGLYLKKPRFPLLLIFALGVYAAYLSSSRAAILHIFVGIVVVSPILLRRLTFSSFILILMAAVGAIMTIVSYADDGQVIFTLKRFDIFNLSGESTFFQTGRYENWKIFLAHGSENFFFGIGFKNVIPILGVPGDNAFITNFVELGFFAALSYGVVWTTFIVKSLKIRNFYLKFAMTAIVLSEIFHMFTLDTHTMWSTSPLVLLFVAAGLRVAEAVRHPPRVKLYSCG